ncbi:SMP-30/gluconolactonase/LRE family protein [Sphingomonas sp. KR1UV-12]|uniref:SMP-30/gluconolactonase/LRE family protein n=1 Tax=Sphingomonas aurea TaxID=3063994 RepID=A0ABT9EP57_9SPHN|nr:SMP-30/gluconolactonase/LRE family protein [Sphingomonas sp. KR1UV-12]MDP1028591.1 SMP-30/gluconolactonase/LRE family protein [Sphingomonas sp. KR1UV-12]
MASSSARVIPGSGRSTLGEGPLWSAREGAVYWVDILGKRLHRLTLADGAVTRWDMPRPIGWAVERETQPGFIAGFDTGFAELTLDPLTIRPIGDPEPDLADNRMNDAKADAKGRIWAGTMPFSCEGDSGAFYRLDPDLSWVKADGPYCIPNGPAIAADGTWMVHTDTARGTIYRYAINDDGSLAPRTPFVTFEAEWGSPDGMTFDADGGLWVAHWGTGQVSRFDPDGRRERWLTLPASQITSCTFAGEGLDRMFVTSAADGKDDEEHAGALFEVDPGCRGLPTPRFGG